MPYEREQAELVRDAYLETCRDIEQAGTGTPSSPYLRPLAQMAADVVRALGDDAAPELVGALADAFQLSRTDAARLISDPEAQQQLQERVDQPRLAAVLEGSWAGRYVQALSQTESPDVYHLAALLTAVSAALARRTMIDWELFPVWPNLYTLLVGPTGARKNTAIKYALRTVSEICPFLMQLPAEGSPQGLVAALQLAHERIGASAGLIVAPELKVLLGGDRYKQAYVEWLTDLYDAHERWERGLRSEQVVLEKVYLGLLGGSTLEWMRQLPASALRGGFLGRCWLVYAPGKRGWRYRPRIDTRTLRQLQEHLRPRLLTPPPRLTLARDADRWLEQWYEHWLPSRLQSLPPEAHPMYERLLVQLLRMAQVLHVLDGSGTVIELETVKRAHGILELTERGTLAVLTDLGTAADGALVRDLLDVLKAHGGRATHRQLVKRLQLRWARSRVEEALRTLVYTGTISEHVHRAERTFTLRDMEV